MKVLVISQYIKIVNNPGCDTYPCYNGGTCVYADGGAKCNCRPDSYGEHCEITEGIIPLFCDPFDIQRNDLLLDLLII